MRVVGVDGCPGGWLAVSFDGNTLEARFHPTFADLVLSYPGVGCIAVDVPIGLSAGAPRACDLAARRLLGKRGSSVFPAPDPRLLDFATHQAASEQSRQLSGKGISIQSFGICPKVAEVNRQMTPLLQNWIVEVHPEVSFWALAGGRAMAYRKGDPVGYEERASLLRSALGVHIPDQDEARKMKRPCSPDDVLDAIVAAWSAMRFANDVAGRLPGDPEYDERGLRIEIVF